MSATTTSGSPALAPFHPLVREWFERAFPAPTPAQERGWPAIAAGESSLILAPTGSGKTLAAFLWALNGLAAARLEGRPTERVLYLSPLKALNYDVERNLRAPLAGIASAAERAGIAAPEISVAVRTGDTPQRDPPADAAHAARRADHHAGEPLPAADLAGAGHPGGRPRGDRRRDPRRRRHQARHPPRAQPRAAGAPGRRRRRAAPAHRPLGHPAPAVGDRALPGRPGRRGAAAAGHDRQRGGREAARPAGHRPGGRHARARHGGARARGGPGRAGRAASRARARSGPRCTPSSWTW